ncbi:MAG TPA: septum formation initiator family protein [Chthoniobacteraceae bacterium]|nr:septum formation initiator family protein [Chthoniobacteraceae bacterium]
MSVSYYDEYKQRRQEGIWGFLCRLACVLLVLVFVALLICWVLPMVHKQKEFSARQDELKRQITEQTELLSLRNRQIEWLKEPEYLETIARDRLDLMKPGETILRMEPPGAAVPAAPATKPH